MITFTFSLITKDEVISILTNPDYISPHSSMLHVINITLVILVYSFPLDISHKQQQLSLYIILDISQDDW